MPDTAAYAQTPTPEQAVERYGLWIKRTALHLTNMMPWADVDELIQWGVLGLLEARERFDPSRGKAFGAFAERRIRGAMLDSLRRDGNQARRVNRAPDAVMANTIGQSQAYSDPLESVLRQGNTTAIAAAAANLSERQQLILQLFFVEGLNNREIAQVLEVSEAYVSKTRKTALERIASQLNATDHSPGDRS
ncbi:MAG TPA: sigma-70 family RNA polymerase sigma factor [Gammaproteobacteria bacterium]|nr:sigma-70 family RNA polymerase sigma factor [Gammaproteobacteria bacterium]